MIEVVVADDAWKVLPDVEALVEKAALAALAGREGDATVVLTSDEAVRELNIKFRGKNAPTNVLSFSSIPNAQMYLGDIAVAFGVCAEEAAQQDKTLAHHLQHLVAHGVLHLLGYDHDDDAEAQTMEDLERRILAGLGIGDPYA